MAENIGIRVSSGVWRRVMWQIISKLEPWRQTWYYLRSADIYPTARRQIIRTTEEESNSNEFWNV